jgi:hypothetical protein
MNVRILSMLVAAGLLASCASKPPVIHTTVTPYVAPTSGSVATLQVRSNQVAGLGVLSSFVDQRSCMGTRMITNTRVSQNQLKASTSLQADEPASLWFAYVAPGNRICNVALTFKPGKDKNYLAYANVTELGCGLVVQDITDPLNPKSEPSRFQRTFVSGSLDAAHCAPTDVDAQISKARKPNLSGLKMEDLKALLPAEKAAELPVEK